MNTKIAEALEREERRELLEAARTSLGIYPQSITRDGVTSQRTPWQDGWNAAILALLKNYEGITTWIAALPIETAQTVRELIAADVLYLHFKNDIVTCFVAMSDTFEYACADAEDVTVEELPLVAGIWRDYGADGLTAWAATRRDEAPIRERQTERYHAARTSLGTR